MLGEYLKNKREEKGWTLKELSKATRIRTDYLAALEREEFYKLPGEVFVRGYIRCYLKALCIDPKEAIEIYEREFVKDVSPSLPPPKPGQPVYRRPIFGVSMVLILLILSFSVYRFFQADNRAITQEVKLDKPPVSQPTKGLSLNLNPINTAEADYTNRHILEVNTLEETWIYLKIDENLSYSMLLQPGENKKWTAKDGFFLKIGNAGGIEITFDGKEIGVPGKRGQVMRISLPGDLKRFLPEEDTSSQDE